MTKPTSGQIRQLSSLSQLTGLALEARLGDLRKAAEARDETRAALAALCAARPDPEGDISMAALARADLLYDQWVEGRRAAMNLQLARQTAVWLEHHASAAMAFGRNDVLSRMRIALQAKLLMQSKRQ